MLLLLMIQLALLSGVRSLLMPRKRRLTSVWSSPHLSCRLVRNNKLIVNFIDANNLKDYLFRRCEFQPSTMILFLDISIDLKKKLIHYWANHRREFYFKPKKTKLIDSNFILHNKLNYQTRWAQLKVHL